MAENSKKPRGKPFTKGKTGNKGGRPKRTPEEYDLINACKNKTPDALAVIVNIMESGESEKNRLSAAQVIIERAYGRPEQQVKADITGGLTVEVIRFGDKVDA